jgi:hypothetical protein
MTEIVGVTFPIEKRFMDRFFIQKKTVFIKPATIFAQVREGMSFVFYQSRVDTGFVGEGKIKYVYISEDPFLFFDKYQDKIFLTPEELHEYIKTQQKWKSHSRHPKKKNWIAIELKNIQKYKNVIKTKNFVTVGGRYITQDEKTEINNSLIP